MCSWYNYGGCSGDNAQSHDSPHSPTSDHCPYTSHSPDCLDHTVMHTDDSSDSQYHSFNQCDDNAVLSPGYGGGEDFFGMSLTRQQIREHNREVRWQQWITLKGNVYDTTSFRDHFIAYNKKKAAENASNESASSDSIPVETTHQQEHSSDPRSESYSSSLISHTIDDLLRSLRDDGDEESNRNENIDADNDGRDDCDDDDEDSCGSDSRDSSDDVDFLWKYDVITALRKTGLSMSDIEAEIRPFKIGTLQDPSKPRWKFWDSIRTDVLALSDDITHKDDTDIGKYEREYLALLQRWLRKYRDIDPLEKNPGGDGNIGVFFLTEDPDSLRDWVTASPPFDTEIPDSGAWPSSELLLSPLGDTHDVFSAALRSHNANIDPFSHDIHGKVAWAELPQDVIKNDQMTPDQQLIHESRLRRGNHLHDPAVMRKRREQLGDYFQKKYHYRESEMAKHLQWASVMEQNVRDLDALCQEYL